MKKILITGFDPFGGESVNPAREAVLCLPDTVGGYEITNRLVKEMAGLFGICELKEVQFRFHQHT